MKLVRRTTKAAGETYVVTILENGNESQMEDVGAWRKVVLRKRRNWREISPKVVILSKG